VSQYPINILKAEGKTGKQFFIREDCPFSDLPALLSFYKMNMFESTSLIRPVDKDKVGFAEKRSGEVSCIM